jgi:hypothetical protein
LPAHELEAFRQMLVTTVPGLSQAEPGRTRTLESE